MFNKIVVDYYGALTPVNQLASLTVPEPRMAVITPYDKGSLQAIERAIRDSDLGVNPTNDGTIIRIVFPQLTEERRREFIKVARTKAEDAKVSIRNIRRKAKDELDRMKKDGETGEDDGRPRREGARQADVAVRRQRRRAAAAQGSRAARGLMATLETNPLPRTTGPAREGPVARAQPARRHPHRLAVGRADPRAAVLAVPMDLRDRHRRGDGGRHLRGRQGAGGSRRGAAAGCRCSPAASRWSCWLRAGLESLFVALVLTVLACIVWRLADPAEGYLRDTAAATFTAVYVPFLISFAALLLAGDDGPRRVTAFIATVVCSDVGGYAAGRAVRQAPDGAAVSPKKSWEGFAGSVLACAAAGAIFFVDALARSPGGWGVVFGLAVVARRDPGRPRRVDGQARPRHQGHGQPAARPRRPDGPARLAAPDRAGRLPAAPALP